MANAHPSSTSSHRAVGLTTKPRRNIRGLGFDELNWRTMESPDDSDSPFGVREYLQGQVSQNPTLVSKLVSLPSGVDQNVWVYEHTRQICIELNYFLGYLHAECTLESCPEMIVGEWRFLCAGHRPPRQCPALHYTVHTLDCAIETLADVRQFPHLIEIPEPSVRALRDIARRFDRIFAHCYSNHRQTFQSFENHYHTYARFSLLIQHYNLVDEGSITMPELARRYSMA